MRCRFGKTKFQKVTILEYTRDKKQKDQEKWLQKLQFFDFESLFACMPLPVVNNYEDC